MEIAVNHPWAVQQEALKCLKLVAGHEYSYSLTIMDKLYQMMENGSPPQVSEIIIIIALFGLGLCYVCVRGRFDLFRYTSH